MEFLKGRRRAPKEILRLGERRSRAAPGGGGVGSAKGVEGGKRRGRRYGLAEDEAMAMVELEDSGK